MQLNSYIAQNGAPLSILRAFHESYTVQGHAGSIILNTMQKLILNYIYASASARTHLLKFMSMSTIVMYIRIFILGIYNAHEEGKRMCCNF